MILRRDEHLARRELLHRVVPAAVPVRELEGRGAEREADQLMAEADAEDRHFPFGDGTDGSHGVRDRLRIAGAVGEEDAVGLAARALPGLLPSRVPR